MANECPKCRTENPSESKFCMECAAPLTRQDDGPYTRTLETPVEELTTGSTFAGRYQIIEELGRGGMGWVYKALDKETREKIALKLIKPEIAADKRTIDRFRSELTTARRIGHKNVCRMYDLNRAGSGYFITMEYVPGQDLKGLIRQTGSLPVPKAVSVARQVCEGLQEAHRLGVVHRDLKPSNIMIDREGNARIMDFGIARTIREKGITGSGVMVGTPEYMSPEQAEAKDVDPRSDIYSLGVVLYEMVTGRLPFEGDTALSVAMKHKSETPRAPKALDPHVPDGLSRLILKCLEKDRQARYQDAGQLLAELNDISQGLPSTQKDAPKRKVITSKEITVSFNVRKLLIPGAALAALAVILAAVLWLLPGKGPEHAPLIENSIAVISFENQTGDEAYDHLQDMIPNLLITNLENTGKYYVVTWERMRDLLKKVGKGNVDFIDSDTGFEICRVEGVKAIVTGRYTKAGDVFALNVNVLDVNTKKSIRSANSTGEGESSVLRTQIDELSRSIARSFGGEGGRSDPLPFDIKEVTTDSIEAFNNFLKGKEAYERGYLRDATKFFERAVEVDADFASPYLYLVWLYSLVPDTKRMTQALETAKSLADRATDKDRLYIAAEYANFVENDPDRYVGVLREIARKYPREKIIYHHLGDYYWTAGRIPEAIREYLKGLELAPDYSMLLYHAALTYLLLEDTEKAARYLERHEASAPEDAVIPYLWGGLHLIHGRLDAALSRFKESLEMKPDYTWPVPYIFHAQAMKEEYSEVLSWIDKLHASWPNDEGSFFYRWKATYLYWLGDLDGALDHVDKAEAFLGDRAVDTRLILNWMKFAIHYARSEFDLCRTDLERHEDIIERYPWIYESWRSLNYSDYLSGTGLLDLKNGKIDLAESRVKEAESMQIRVYWPRVESYKRLQGEIWLAKGSYDQAIDAAKDTVPIRFSHGALCREYVSGFPFSGDLAARAYEKRGDLNEAIEEYERLTTPEPGERGRWLIHPLYHFRLAKLYELKGWKGKALERYERFLDLWKAADPLFSEVGEAKKRAAALSQYP